MGAVKFSRSYIRAKVLMHLQLSPRRHQGAFCAFFGQEWGIKKFSKKFYFFVDVGLQM